MQVLWYLLGLHSTRSPITFRITEIYALCIQQATEWPSVSAYLMEAMTLPAQVIQQLHDVEAAQQREPEGSFTWKAATDQRALMLVGT